MQATESWAKEIFMSDAEHERVFVQAHLDRMECPTGCYALLDVKQVGMCWLRECPACGWVELSRPMNFFGKTEAEA